MDNFRIVSDYRHMTFVNENENIQPWGVCLRCKHINDIEDSTVVQTKSHSIERFVRFIVGAEQDKEG